MAGRDEWKRARDKRRHLSRHNLRNRLRADGVITSSPAATISREQATPILLAIFNGDRSHFSTAFLDKNYHIFNKTVPVDFLYETDGKILLEHRLLSWYKQEGLERFRSLLDSHQSFTFLELSVWLERYHIVYSLLRGHVSPVPRGEVRDALALSHDEAAKLEKLAIQVSQGFWESLMPLSLQSYVVKRIVDLRKAALGVTIASTCASCHQPLSASLALKFGDDCLHVVCERCFWETFLVEFTSCTRCFVVCPVCAQQRASVDDREKAPMPPHKTRRSLFLETRDRYLVLPKDAKELKASLRRVKTQESELLASSWAKAVICSLGKTQSVRKDKFFYHCQRGSFHHVIGCLEAGIDLSLSNEYGQTGLMVALWYGHDDVAEVLIRHGSEPNHQANGGFMCLDIVGDGESSGMRTLLEESDARRAASTLEWLSTCRHAESSANQLNPLLNVLVDPVSDHPGAGSYLLDNCISAETAQALKQLFDSLPVGEEKREKGIPCSRRSYFCDHDGTLRKIVSTALLRSGRWHDGDFIVFGLVRFLCYDEAGALLPPHIDLSRTCPSSGESSTHSFLLYLTDCFEGGATSLLTSLTDPVPIVQAAPRRGRLLLFPHQCPHQGQEVGDVPKLLIRGEVLLRR